MPVAILELDNLLLNMNLAFQLPRCILIHRRNLQLRNVDQYVSSSMVCMLFDLVWTIIPYAPYTVHLSLINMGLMHGSTYVWSPFLPDVYGESVVYWLPWIISHFGIALASKRVEFRFTWLLVCWFGLCKFLTSIGFLKLMKKYPLPFLLELPGNYRIMFLFFVFFFCFFEFLGDNWLPSWHN